MAHNLEEIIFPDIIKSHYNIVDVNDKGKEILIEIKPEKHSCQCPVCGKESKRVHSKIYRTIQDLPLNNKTVYLKIDTNLYTCQNPECEVQKFEDNLDFVRSYGQRTFRLDAVILAVSMFLSNEGASRVLGEMGIRISADSIKNMYDRLEFADDSEVEEIGIDDVALRKGQKYGTVVYDMKDHHMIALFEGRTVKETERWLKEHPKIKKVARDRASAYAMAITEILPDCMQVADTFHLLQNLIDRIEEILSKDLPDKFFFKDGKLLDEEPERIESYKAISQERQKTLDQLDYDNSPPLDFQGNVIDYDNKRHGDHKERERKRKLNRKKKQEKIRKIQDFYNSSEAQEKTQKEIAQMFGIAVKTLKRYREMSEEEIKALDKPKNYKKQNSPMNDYLNIIYKMIRDGYSPLEIFYYVYNQPGFSSSERTLENYIYLFTQNNFPEKNFSPRIFKEKTYSDDITIITRKDILDFIIKGNSKIEKFNDYYEQIITQYPEIENLNNAYQEFYKVIMGDKVEDLQKFITHYQNDSYLSGFIASIKKDIAAVENAISTNISSGFVEGLNCKFKLVKRILYGRANSVNLEKKCKLAFLPYDKEEGYRLEKLLRESA